MSDVITVSVAMTTYNGERFLDQQLTSIGTQTRQPDEIVICDDGSVDNTAAIVARFAENAPFAVHFIRNPVRLGWAENFLNAARRCRSDLVAWSDQDDVWMPEKLARCLTEFHNDRDVVMVVHARQIGDWVSRGRPVVRGPRRRKVYGPASLPWAIGARGNASVISRRVIDVGDALQARVPGIFDRVRSHDTWAVLLAGGLGKVVVIPDALVQYRQHGEQAEGEAPLRTQADRARRSVERSASQFDAGLEAEIARSLTRASVLGDLATLLHDTEAGSGRGARRRERMWIRHAEAHRRRLGLWRQRPCSLRAAACLIRGVLHGDYGRRQRGRLGLRSCVRDLWRVTSFTARRSAGASSQPD